jgi:hypothetical protein
MARKDYVPLSTQNIRDWSANYLAQIDAVAQRINWSGDRVGALKTALTNVSTAAQAVLDKQAALDTATGLLDNARELNIAVIRRDTANLKASPGFSEGDARTLGVFSGVDVFDPTTYKPVLTAEENRERISLMARKLGVDSLNLYVRRKGETPWRVLAQKRVRFPYLDTALPATTGAVVEEREYRAIGVIDDDEIGQPSDIVSAMWRT